MKRSRGFTLIELMVVVAIVGILAVLGVVGYRRLISSARMAEPRQVLMSIRLAQESYKAETGSYAAVSSAFGTAAPGALCPKAVPDDKKYAWDTTCGAGTVTFGVLTVQTDGPVIYGYATTAGSSAPGAITYGTTPLKITPPTAAGPWFFAYASGDTDANGSKAYLFTSSYAKEILQEDE